MAHLESTKRPAQLRREGAWQEVTAKFDEAIDTMHLKLIAVELAPTIEAWPETWKVELREYYLKAMAELPVNEGPSE